MISALIWKTTDSIYIIEASQIYDFQWIVEGDDLTRKPGRYLLFLVFSLRCSWQKKRYLDMKKRNADHGIKPVIVFIWLVSDVIGLQPHL